MKPWVLSIVGAAVVGTILVVGWRWIVPKGVTSCRQCNVILISIDTLRADHVGAYGYPRPTTPVIDRLRREAVLFSTAIAQAPSTAASHGAMLTGMIPSRHGALFARRTSLSPEVPTLAELLQSRGYRTASFNGGGQIVDTFGFGRGFEIYQSTPGYDGANDRFRDQVSAARAWIEKVTTAPFFLFLHTYEVHQPYAPSPEHLSLFSRDYRGSVAVPITMRTLLQMNAGQRRVTDADRQFIIDAYDAEIRSVDEAMGEFLSFLKAKGLYDSSLIIVTSDHGEELGERGRMGMHSHTLYDELLRVPLIVKFPNQARRGATVTQQVRSMDIPPTILDLIGAPLPPALQGRTLIPLIEGRAKESDFAIALSQRDSKRELPLSVRTMKWKTHHRRLFDLETDPGERIDRVAENPDVRTELLSAGEQLMGEAQEGPAADLDDENLEQLKTLGYLQ